MEALVGVLGYDVMINGSQFVKSVDKHYYLLSLIKYTEFKGH